jgi:Copper type II ascorbate-dependent monooxygenase, C-terminal domain
MDRADAGGQFQRRIRQARIMRRGIDPIGALGALLLASCGGDGAPCEGAACGQEALANAAKDAGNSSAPAVVAASDARAPQAPLDASVVPSGGGALPCDVAELVSERCGLCHGEKPSGGAPMSLANAADFQVTRADGGNLLALIEQRVSEQDPTKRMPPSGYPALSADQRKTLQAWLAKGAPVGDEKCDQAVDASVPKDAAPPIIEDGELTCYKLLAHNGDGKTKYQVGLAADSYVNFVYDAPWQETAYGIVIRPVIDNAKILHHWLLFQDDIAGFASGPTPEIGAHPTGQLIAGWAPGAEPTDFRLSGADVGFELPANTTYNVEFHYNSSDLDAQDQSGVEICAVKRKPANVAAISWLGLDQLVFPSQQWIGTCSPLSNEPIHITQVWPHMHTKGRHMKSTINRANGEQEILHDGDFDFNYQRAYRKDVTLLPGDTITTVCDYAEPMAFGESTTEEMCYLFTTAYPKGALAGFDLWGTFAHGGSSCLGM